MSNQPNDDQGGDLADELDEAEASEFEKTVQNMTPDHLAKVAAAVLAEQDRRHGPASRMASLSDNEFAALKDRLYK